MPTLSLPLQFGGLTVPPPARSAPRRPPSMAAALPDSSAALTPPQPAGIFAQAPSAGAGPAMTAPPMTGPGPSMMGPPVPPPDPSLALPGGDAPEPFAFPPNLMSLLQLAGFFRGPGGGSPFDSRLTDQQFPQR